MVYIYKRLNPALLLLRVSRVLSHGPRVGLDDPEFLGVFELSDSAAALRHMPRVRPHDVNSAALVPAPPAVRATALAARVAEKSGVGGRHFHALPGALAEVAAHAGAEQDAGASAFPRLKPEIGPSRDAPQHTVGVALAANQYGNPMLR